MKAINNPFQIVNNYRQNAPVNVDAIAYELGLELRRANMLPEESGQIEKKDDNSYLITVNKNHSQTRQRFTIAHEIGHYILHRNKIGDGITDDKLYRGSSSGKFKNMNIGAAEETEANQLAANILMPFDLIQRLQSEGCSAPEELASRLGVSLQALKIRLENIKK